MADATVLVHLQTFMKSQEYCIEGYFHLGRFRCRVGCVHIFINGFNVFSRIMQSLQKFSPMKITLSTICIYNCIYVEQQNVNSANNIRQFYLRNNVHIHYY